MMTAVLPPFHCMVSPNFSCAFVVYGATDVASFGEIFSLWQVSFHPSSRSLVLSLSLTSKGSSCQVRLADHG